MRLRIGLMSSAVKADKLEAALEAAIRRFDGTSPVTSQVHASFGFPGVAVDPAPRLRMQLVLEVVAAEGAALDEGIDVACAVEILHNSTLVHDMVEVAERAPFGLAHGINAGDALCALAYLQLLDGPWHRPSERTVEMTRTLQAANFALCAGQAQELSLTAGASFGDDAYLAMIAGKAALFSAACELGAFAAGASSERARAYGRLGRACATAFQMEDHVHADPAARTWPLPPVASLATARAYLAEGDAIAAASGIDAGGRVRAFFTRAIHRTV
jgi:geranylgeranyl pyrophosphate synthase